MKRILNQCIKELSIFRRDRISVFLALILPIVIVLIYGYAIRLETKNIPLGIQDFDNSLLSRTYTEIIYATNKFIPAPIKNLEPNIAIDSGVAKAIIIIPPNFSQLIKSKKSVALQILIDATDVNNARIMQSSIEASNHFFLQSNNYQPVVHLIEAKTRIWFNPGRKESLYIVPGVFGIILWVFPSMLTAISIVREKEENTIIQVYASDFDIVEWLLGKGLAFLLIALAEALTIIIVSMLLFGLHLQGEVTPLITGTLAFLGASVSFGLLVGTRAINQAVAVQGTAITGFLTTFLLSGFIYRLENIPFPLSVISNLIPARYYIVITRNAFISGTGWAGIWYMPIFIASIGFLLFAAAYKSFQGMQFPD